MNTPKIFLLATSAIAALVTTTACPSEDDGDDVAERNYIIEIEAGHTHVFKTYDVTFAVRDLDDCTDDSDTTTCTGISGLPVRVVSQPFGQGPAMQELEADAFVDNGDGTYTWRTWFEWFVPYVVSLEFEEDGNAYSQAFPFETSKAGGEAIFCPSRPDPVPEGWAPSHNYQVRWHATPGHIVADGATPVSFDLDLRRTIEVTNVEQPWRNEFDHLEPENLEIPEGGVEADRLTVEIVAKDAPGTPLATYKLGTTDADVKYVGLGIYRVTHTFAAADVGAGESRMFTLHVVFDDDAMHEAEECPVIDEMDDAEHQDYSFPVYAPNG